MQGGFMYLENKFKMLARILWLPITLLLLPIAAAQEYKAKSASVPAPKKVTAPLATRALPPPNPQAELREREARLQEHYRRGPLRELPLEALRAAPPPTVAATDVAVPTPAMNVHLNSNQPLPGTATSNMTSHVD